MTVYILWCKGRSKDAEKFIERIYSSFSAACERKRLAEDVTGSMFEYYIEEQEVIGE